jgi:hypothetical protein
VAVLAIEFVQHAAPLCSGHRGLPDHAIRPIVIRRLKALAAKDSGLPFLGPDAK